jgi:hypothetical protein
MAAYHPPLLGSTVQAYQTLVPEHKFYDTMAQQVPVSPVHLIRAAALVAAKSKDADVVRFVSRAVIAVQRGNLQFYGDFETIACLRWVSILHHMHQDYCYASLHMYQQKH